nr:ribosomal biogenesis factor-like [Oryctolagus cuniculus]
MEGFGIDRLQHSGVMNRLGFPEFKYLWNIKNCHNQRGNADFDNFISHLGITWSWSCGMLVWKTTNKNKLRQKPRNVLHIVSQKDFKAKNKAILVTTNLEIKIANEDKVKSEKTFMDTQKESAHYSRGPSLEPLHKKLTPPRGHENEPINDEPTR